MVKWRHERPTGEIADVRGVAELGGVGGLQIKGIGPLGAVQRACAAKDDRLEVTTLSAVQCLLETSPSRRINHAYVVLQQDLAVASGVVRIALLVAVGRVWRDGKSGVFPSSRGAKVQGHPDPVAEQAAIGIPRVAGGTDDAVALG